MQVLLHALGGHHTQKHEQDGTALNEREVLQWTRKYMLCINSNQLKWHPAIADSGNALHADFARLCPFQLGDQKLGSSADEAFFVAPAAHITCARQEAAAARSFPDTKRNVKLWSDYQIMAPGHRTCLQLH